MTKRRTTLALLAFLLPIATVALAQPATIIPSGTTATESREVRGFTGVGFSLPGTLVLRQGPAAPLLIEAADNLLPEIETVVEGGTLKIRFRRAIDVRGRAGIQILLTGPDFDSLAVSGSGDVVSEGLKSRSLKVAISGSGSVRIAKLDTDSLTASLAGSGGFRAAGRATEVVAKLAGSGAMDTGRLESSRVRASVAGSADATFWARESLEATIAGSGDVRYYGDPAVTKRTAGSGTLKRLGTAP